MAEQAYAGDLKSSARKGVPVRIREGLLIVAASLTASARGGVAESDGPGGGSGSVSVDDFPARYAAAFCALTGGCCELAGGEPSDDCVASEQAAQEADAAAAERASASFDAQAAEDCLAALANVSCQVDALSLLGGLLPRCDVWRGRVQPGGSCQSHIECRDSETGASVGCVNGVCEEVQHLPRGAPCDEASFTAVCFRWLDFCDAESRLCTALPEPGDACTDECSYGATCDAGTCRALLVPGDVCTTDTDCASDTCVDGRCASLLAGDYCAHPE